MKRFSAFAAAAILWSSGCVPSINPLYTPDTLTYEPKLIGVWSEKEESKDAWIFTSGGENQYHLTIREDDGKNSSPMIARLVKLEGQLFLDLFPDGKALEELKIGAFYKSALVPGHLILKVGQIGDRLELSLLDNDRLRELLEKAPDSLAHSMLEDRIVLTASTADLQKFFKQHAKDTKIWGDPGVMKKRSS